MHLLITWWKISFASNSIVTLMAVENNMVLKCHIWKKYQVLLPLSQVFRGKRAWTHELKVFQFEENKSWITIKLVGFTFMTNSLKSNTCNTTLKRRWDIKNLFGTAIQKRYITRRCIRLNSNRISGFVFIEWYFVSFYAQIWNFCSRKNVNKGRFVRAYYQYLIIYCQNLHRFMKILWFAWCKKSMMRPRAAVSKGK